MTDELLSAKDVDELVYELYSDKDFTLTFEAKKQLLMLASHFLKTHEGDGTPKVESAESRLEAVTKWANIQGAPQFIGPLWGAGYSAAKSHVLDMLNQEELVNE